MLARRLWSKVLAEKLGSVGEKGRPDTGASGQGSALGVWAGRWTEACARRGAAAWAPALDSAFFPALVTRLRLQRSLPTPLPRPTTSPPLGTASQPCPEAPPMVSTGFLLGSPTLWKLRWVGCAGSQTPGSSGRGSRGAVGPLQARSRRQPRPGQSPGNDSGGGGQPWRPATGSACPRLPTPGARCIPANSNCAEPASDSGRPRATFVLEFKGQAPLRTTEKGKQAEAVEIQILVSFQRGSPVPCSPRRSRF